MGGGDDKKTLAGPRLGILRLGVKLYPLGWGCQDSQSFGAFWGHSALLLSGDSYWFSRRKCTNSNFAHKFGSAVTPDYAPPILDKVFLSQFRDLLLKPPSLNPFEQRTEPLSTHLQVVP